MKSFKLFLALLCLIYISDKCVYYILSSLDKKVYTSGNIGKINHFDKIKDTTKVLFFGSSRTNHHIDPKFFGSSSFNVGFGGRKTAFSATLLLTLPKTKFTQVVFLHLDPSYSFDNSYTGSDVDALYIKYHKNSVIKNKIDELNMNNPLSSFFWSIDYNGMVISLFKNYYSGNAHFNNYKGFDPIHNSKEQLAIFKKRLLKKQELNCDKKYVFSEVELKLLREVKKFCLLNNKKLILITSPVYKDSCKDDNIVLNIFLKKEGFNYFDYTNLFQNNDDLQLWKDENHLSNIGAEKFSKVLAEDFKSLINESSK